MSETREIVLTRGNATQVQEALAFLEQFLAASPNCRGFLLTRDPQDPARRIWLNWAWETDAWRAIAWQHTIDILAEAGLEFTISANVAEPALA